MSGGVRQSVTIALALACRPALRITDEPITALDVTIQAQILDLMRKLQKELGMGMLFITHNLGVVAEIANDVAVMYARSIALPTLAHSAPKPALRLNFRRCLVRYAAYAASGEAGLPMLKQLRITSCIKRGFVPNFSAPNLMTARAVLTV